MKKLFIAPMLVLIAACSGPKHAATAPSTTDLKVISFNMRYGTSVKDGDNCWENRKTATLAMVREQMPDVMGVQEGITFQLDYITDNIKEYKCVGVGRDDGIHAGEHMSIFYNTKKVTLLDWGTYWLSPTPDKPSKGWNAACKRTATWTKFKENKSGKIFFYVNTHLDHKSSLARKNGLALIVERIAAMNPGNAPMILTGDFNIRPNHPDLEGLNKIMLSARNTAIDGYNKGSFNGFGQALKSDDAPDWGSSDWKAKQPGVIDYIYYSGFSKCLSFKVLDKPYGNVPYISDHWPIVSVLEF